LLRRASAGDAEALGRLLEMYRAAIRAQAAAQLDGRLEARVDASDVVQETFLEAHRDFASFRGGTEAEWIEWLNRILANNIVEAVRRHDGAGKRSVRAERSLQDAVRGGLGLQRILSVEQSTPGQQAVRNEQLEDLEAAIELLLPDQREAIRLRYLQGRSLRQIAEHLGRTERAVASLLHRAVKELERRLTRGSRNNE
jgi:RNA polymerase sigma-70 factor (ECF subfamily)